MNPYIVGSVRVGNDITYQYYVSKKYGKLEVSARELHITVNDARKNYDGTPLESDEYSIEDPNQLVEGHFLDDLVFSGAQTNVGVSENQLTNVRIYAVIDNQLVDVTNNYIITSTPGKLRVDP